MNSIFGWSLSLSRLIKWTYNRKKRVKHKSSLMGVMLFLATCHACKLFYCTILLFVSVWVANKVLSLSLSLSRSLRAHIGMRVSMRKRAQSFFAMDTPCRFFHGLAGKNSARYQQMASLTFMFKKIPLRPELDSPRTRLGSLRRSSDPLVGWGGDTPSLFPIPLTPSAPKASSVPMLLSVWNGTP